MKFIKSVIQEMHNVTWPTARENRHDTATVVGTAILFSAYFALVDWLVLLALNAFVF